MFQFPEFAPIARYHTFSMMGCPIRKSTDQLLFAHPRSLSQLITSFFASESLGIPRVPFLTFFYHVRLLLGPVCFLVSCIKLYVLSCRL